MNFKTTLIAAALFAASASSFAVTPGNLGTIDNLAINIGNSFSAAGAISDNYTFTLVNPGTASGIVATFNYGQLFNVSGLTISLTGGSIVGSLVDNNPADGYNFGGLTAGNYTFHVAGTVTGSLGGAYGGVIQAVTAPVPEPESYALMLAGLAAIGFVARRRQA